MAATVCQCERTRTDHSFSPVRSFSPTFVGLVPYRLRSCCGTWPSRAPSFQRLCREGMTPSDIVSLGFGRDNRKGVSDASFCVARPVARSRTGLERPCSPKCRARWILHLCVFSRRVNSREWLDLVPTRNMGPRGCVCRVSRCRSRIYRSEPSLHSLGMIDHAVSLATPSHRDALSTISQALLSLALCVYPPLAFRSNCTCVGVSPSVWVLGDLEAELERQGWTPEEAMRKVDGIMADMRVLTADLFRVSTRTNLDLNRTWNTLDPFSPCNCQTVEHFLHRTVTK